LFFQAMRNGPHSFFNVASRLKAIIFCSRMAQASVVAWECAPVLCLSARTLCILALGMFANDHHPLRG
jgi:hypothetical protein